MKLTVTIDYHISRMEHNRIYSLGNICLYLILLSVTACLLVGCTHVSTGRNIVKPTSIMTDTATRTQLAAYSNSGSPTLHPSNTPVPSTARFLRQPAESTEVYPHREQNPTVVSTTTETASSTPQPTTTFDASRVLKATPNPPAKCPQENPDLIPSFVIPFTDPYLGTGDYPELGR